MASVLGPLISGIAAGMLLFLAAIGLTIIFGILDVLNFAHGSFYMLGAYSLYFLTRPDWPFAIGNFWLAALVSILLVALIGGVIEFLIIRPIYKQDHIFQLLLTFALVLVIDNSVRIFAGTGFQSVSMPGVFNFRVDVFGATTPAYNLFLIAAGGIAALAVWLFFERTQIGLTAIASAEDRDTASALGVNVPAVYTSVFILGSALAGLGGVLSAPFFVITPTMGENIIILAFIVVIIGGIGSFAGTLIASLVIGIVQSLTPVLFPILEGFVPFILMIVMVMLFPHGILGEKSTT